MSAGDDLYAKLRASLGQTVEFTAPDELGRAAFRKFGLALGDFNPLYTDRAAAIILVTTFHNGRAVLATVWH